MPSSEKNSHPLSGNSEVYDLVNVGSRNRFTIRTSEGPVLVHNCTLGLGYGTGAGKLQATLKNGGVAMEAQRCKEIVQLYRSTYPNIPTLWKACQKSLDSMYDGYDGEVGCGYKVKFSGIEQCYIFPNKMKLRFPELEREQGTYGYEYTYRKRSFRNKVYGGSLTENLVQGIARIIVCYQMCKIEQALARRRLEANDGKIRKVVHFVHDEVVVVCPEEEAEWTKSMMEAIMTTPPSWAKALPLKCEADIGDTYGDAK